MDCMKTKGLLFRLVMQLVYYEFVPVLRCQFDKIIF
jgi:hypothetical protein